MNGGRHKNSPDEAWNATIGLRIYLIVMALEC